MTRAKSLGKILRKIDEDAKPDSEKTFSLSEAIDKACSEGMTNVGAFSVTGIKRSLKTLTGMMEDFDRDAFFREFFKLYNLVMAPDIRAKNVFHPSGLLDACPRRLVYDLLRVDPSDETKRVVGGQLQRIFDVGTWWHVYLQNLLYTMGLLRQAEVPVVNKAKFINGKADGMFFPEVFGGECVLEIKSMNARNYSMAVFQPFKKHEYQASIYARELGATMILYLYVNKDTSEIKDFLRPVKPEVLADVDKKMDGVIEHTTKKTLPKKVCTDRYSEMALACPFATLCFKS